MQMLLRCAIQNLEEKIEASGSPFSGAYEVLAAAKRELQRQEANKPKRADLREIEWALRTIPMGSSNESIEVIDERLRQHRLRHKEAADILKALREKVVPWLKNGPQFHCCPPHDLRVGEQAKELLCALGEEV